MEQMEQNEDKQEKAYRDKDWSEIDEKEKCKRLRDRVKSLERKVGDLERVACALITHSHNTAGDAVASIGCGLIPSGTGSVGRNGDDVYF